MKVVGVVAVALFVSTVCASDRRDPAEAFFQAVISAGAFEEGHIIQGACYVGDQISVEWNTGELKFGSPSLQPGCARELCGFCNLVLVLPAGEQRFRHVLKKGPKDNVEDMMRKQDKLLAGLLAEWKSYNFWHCPKK